MSSAASAPCASCGRTSVAERPWRDPQPECRDCRRRRAQAAQARRSGPPQGQDTPPAPASPHAPYTASKRPRLPRVPEKHVQAAGVRLLRSLGASVYVLGTRRPRGDFPGTRQTPGIGDVYACLARHALWWECKAQGGRLRPEQAAFRDHCQRLGVPHVVGDLDALIGWLEAHGYCRRAGGPGCTAVEVGTCDA